MIILGWILYRHFENERKKSTKSIQKVNFVDILSKAIMINQKLYF